MKKHISRITALALTAIIAVSSWTLNSSAIDPTSEVQDGEITSSALPGTNFDDVSADAWFTSYVEYVLNKGIMTGIGDNKFAPGDTICRAQFATILYRLSGSQPVPYTNLFPDVPDGTFYTTPVLWAAQENVNVITGYENGFFGPNDIITREQLATMLYRYAEYRKLDTGTTADLSGYPDAASVADFAKEAMAWAVGVGIITGDQGNLNPQGESSRAVCATMVQRFCDSVLPEELPNIEMSASCKNITITPSELHDGTFWVKLTDITAPHGVQKIIAAVWCNENQDDIGYYQAEYQPDASYGFSVNVANHNFHFGTYKVAVYVTMENGVRLYAGETSQQIDGTQALEMRQTAQNYSSSTNYLLVVDTNTCRTGVFFRNGNSWDFMYYWLCSPGAPSSPTVKGVFTVQAKGYGFYSYDSWQYYYTQFYGDYLFHSTTYNEDGSVQDDRLGIQLSHGCVRLDMNNSKWIYDNIPTGTTVVIY